LIFQALNRLCKQGLGVSPSTVRRLKLELGENFDEDVQKIKAEIQERVGCRNFLQQLRDCAVEVRFQSLK